MIGTTTHQAWLFYLPVDQLLNDPELVALVRRCLAGRRPASARTGRTGMAPDRVLRCCVLKHLKGWMINDN